MVRGQSTLHQMLIVSGHDWVGNIHTETINIVSNHILSDLNLATFGWTMTRVAGWAGMGGLEQPPGERGLITFAQKFGLTRFSFKPLDKSSLKLNL